VAWPAKSTPSHRRATAAARIEPVPPSALLRRRPFNPRYWRWWKRAVRLRMSGYDYVRFRATPLPAEPDRRRSASSGSRWPAHSSSGSATWDASLGD